MRSSGSHGPWPNAKWYIHFSIPLVLLDKQTWQREIPELNFMDVLWERALHKWWFSIIMIIMFNDWRAARGLLDETKWIHWTSQKKPWKKHGKTLEKPWKKEDGGFFLTLSSPGHGDPVGLCDAKNSNGSKHQHRFSLSYVQYMLYVQYICTYIYLYIHI